MAYARGRFYLNSLRPLLMLESCAGRQGQDSGDVQPAGGKGGAGATGGGQR